MLAMLLYYHARVQKSFKKEMGRGSKLYFMLNYEVNNNYEKCIESRKLTLLTKIYINF